MITFVEVFSSATISIMSRKGGGRGSRGAYIAHPIIIYPATYM